MHLDAIFDRTTGNLTLAHDATEASEFNDDLLTAHPDNSVRNRTFSFSGATVLNPFAERLILACSASGSHSWIS